ncbi:MAG: type III-A CRISPR-associated RAMP protein Csm3 [Candidatus Ancillula sp.]|nr:type III-A CRISPR-associated RAMP protein Csm3 [Candidatus Ancillula sp.]
MMTDNKYAKIEITGVLELKSGLHIGGSDAFAAIGATDSPVIRDPLTNRPVIPGSSLKGKMRSLLARAINEKVAKLPNDDDEKIGQLFGTSTKGKALRSRLVFTDLILEEAEIKRLRELGAKSTTEVKFENTINRITAVANPRQIERVIAGAMFPFSLVYEIGPKNGDASGDVVFPSEQEIEEDFELLAEGLKLLEYDYIGGSGTRGYGRVKFSDLKADVKIGQCEIVDRLKEKLGAV